MLVNKQDGWMGGWTTSDDGSQKTHRSVLGCPTSANVSRTLWPRSFKPYREKEREREKEEVKDKWKKLL